MGKILVVGLCCIDLVNYVENFPHEDSDTRVYEQITTLGGNAANTCTILSQFDPNGYELLASVPDKNIILDSLVRERRINLIRVERKNASTPISTAIVNQSTGTRTILHYRGNLSELNADEFISQFPSFDDYSWIHFEGRNFDEILKMIEYCNEKRQIKISVELEKIREFNWYDKLIPLVDLIFMSKDFSRNLGFMSMEEAVKGLQNKYNLDQTTVIVPWGELGVAARKGKNGKMIIQKAFEPEKVVDTLAAGDCFIGAALYFLNKNRTLEEILENACKVSGQKCGQMGLLDLNLHEMI